MSDLIVGAHCKDDSESSLADAFAAFEDGTGYNSNDVTSPFAARGGTGDLRGRRTFRSSGGMVNWGSGPWSMDITRFGVEVSWVSFKGSATNMNAGNYDTSITNFISSVPSGHKVIITWRHEPEDDSDLNSSNGSTWRDGQKHLHKLVLDNKGSKDILVAPVLQAYTFDPQSGRTLEDWVPVYESGDTIPSGLAAGDPAWDVFGIDMYDRSTDAGTIYTRWWNPRPPGTGNQLGMTGHLDRIVDIVNTYSGGEDFTRADLHWGYGELATKYGGIEGRGTVADALEWWDELVAGVQADTATCHGVFFFQSDHGGQASPHDLPSTVQADIKAAGAFYADTVTPLIEYQTVTLNMLFDVAETGTPIEYQTVTLNMRFDVETPTDPTPPVSSGRKFGHLKTTSANRLGFHGREE